MEITVQQGAKDEGGITRRNFKVNNGFYENSAYNDGGVPVHLNWLKKKGWFLD